jgi:hypothetical protein
MNKYVKIALAAVGVSGAGTLFLCIICIFGIVGMWLWPYSINTWLVYAGKPSSMLWWHGFLLGMVPVFGKLCVPVALITWIVMMFLT